MVERDEDAALMARFVRTRDRKAFEVLFQKYRRPVLGHARRFVKDDARAEELAQEVFIRLYRTKTYEEQGGIRFKTWLYKVATNVCLNELRKRESKAKLESFDADDSLEAAPEQMSAAPSPEEQIAGKQMARTLGAAIEALPTNQRAALLMARQDGLSHEEIASALETSVSAVKSLIHRALETLRREAERMRAETSAEAKQ
jgi:RNA polymerase sigma-70 factor (ECF subfamily)